MTDTLHAMLVSVTLAILSEIKRKGIETKSLLHFGTVDFLFIIKKKYSNSKSYLCIPIYQNGIIPFAFERAFHGL